MISGIRIFDIRKYLLCSDIKKLNSWYKKNIKKYALFSNSWYQKLNIWCHKMYFLIAENRPYLLYQTFECLISKNRFSDINKNSSFLDIKKSFYWYQKMNLLISEKWFFDIRIFLIYFLISEKKEYFLISKIGIPDNKKSIIWYQKFVFWYQKIEPLISRNVNDFLRIFDIRKSNFFFSFDFSMSAGFNK